MSGKLHLICMKIEGFIMLKLDVIFIHNLVSGVTHLCISCAQRITPWPRGCNFFPCSTHLRMTFRLFANKNTEKSFLLL